MNHFPRHRLPMRLSLITLCLGLAAPVWAQSAAASAPVAVSIPAQPLDKALTALAAQTGMLIGADSSLLAGKQAPALSGTYTPAEALQRLLAGSGLEAVPGSDGSVQLRRAVSQERMESTLPAVTVAAQTGDAPPVYAGGQVATGGRVGLLGNKSIMDMPFNQTSYTAELMADQGAMTIADVLANDPSVRVTGSGLTSTGGAGDIMTIRGFTSGSRDVAFNGIYGIAPTRVFPVETLERVEVLKGPNALINGMAPNGSVGGAINAVPKRADDVPLTRVTLSSATGGLSGLHADVGRRFGDDNRWGVRFNGIYRDGGNAVDGQSVNMQVATVGLDLRDGRLRASLDAGYQYVKTDAPTGAAGIYLLPGLPVPTPPKAERQISQDWEFSESRNHYVLASLEYKLDNDWTAYGSAGWSGNRDLYLSTDKYIFDTAGNAQAVAYYYPGYADRKSVQGGLRGTLQTGVVQHEININASWLEEDTGYLFGNQYGFAQFFTNLYDAQPVPVPSLAGFTPRAPHTGRMTLPTIALADTLSWMDGRVALTLGVRHQRVRNTPYDPDTGVRQAGYDESAITPAVALLVKPSDRLALYGNYIEGLSRGPTAPAGTLNANEVFAPIKTKQVEAGVKYDFGRFALTAGVFQIERPNGVTVPVDGSLQPEYRMDGQQRNRGVEFNAFGEPVRGWRLLGGVAYTDARLTRTQDGVNEGNVAIAAPRWQANLSSEWDMATVPGLTLSARVLATSSQYLDEENLRSIPGWTRWDAGLRYRTQALGKPLVLRANIENLFGRDYWMTASEGWLNQGMPRSVQVSIAMDF